MNDLKLTMLVSIITLALQAQVSPQSSREINEARNTKSLSLRAAIEIGLRQNPNERRRRFNEEILDLNWDDSFYDFWFPKVELTLSSGFGEAYRLANGSSRGQRTSATSIFPTGSLGLNLGEYAIYNWGIDWLGYIIERDTYQRNKQSIKEQRRDLKLRIIDQYFKLSAVKNKLRIAEDYLRHASFIYRIIREQAKSNRISKERYYQVRTQYLKAQSELQLAKQRAIAEDEIMAELLADEPNNIYVLSEGYEYKQHLYPINEAITQAMKTNDSLDNLKLAMQNADRTHEIVQKQNLPLPTLKVNFGAYNNNFGPNGNSTTYETLDGDTNVEVVASIDATWTIFGSGGFLNGRDIERAIIRKKLANYNYYNEKRSVELTIRALYQKLRSLEDEIRISELNYKSAQKTFDALLDKFVGKANKKEHFEPLRETLDLLRDAEQRYEDAKYNHVSLRLSLASTLGIEDFPGEDFENLAVPVRAQE